MTRRKKTSSITIHYPGSYNERPTATILTGENVPSQVIRKFSFDRQKNSFNSTIMHSIWWLCGGVCLFLVYGCPKNEQKLPCLRRKTFFQITQYIGLPTIRCKQPRRYWHSSVDLSHHRYHGSECERILHTEILSKRPTTWRSFLDHTCLVSLTQCLPEEIVLKNDWWKRRMWKRRSLSRYDNDL